MMMKVRKANRCSGTGLLFFERVQILFPFSGQEIFFFVVARFAGRHKIPLHGFAAANDRDQVVHGQICWVELESAIVADAGRAFSLPPL